jgi:hypothetical protein
MTTDVNRTFAKLERRTERIVAVVRLLSLLVLVLVFWSLGVLESRHAAAVPLGGFAVITVAGLVTGSRPGNRATLARRAARRSLFLPWIPWLLASLDVMLLVHCLMGSDRIHVRHYRRRRRHISGPSRSCSWVGRYPSIGSRIGGLQSFEFGDGTGRRVGNHGSITFGIACLAGCSRAGWLCWVVAWRPPPSAQSNATTLGGVALGRGRSDGRCLAGSPLTPRHRLHGR